MVFYQKALKNFIADTLDENSKGILFDTKLYNDISDDDFGETSKVEDTYTVETKRKVQTMITGINGEYIPIPNVTATKNSIEILFDLAIDDMSGLGEEDEFTSVNYDNALLAIDEFRESILANYFPLGTHYLMFGGDDSDVAITNISNVPKVYYIDLELKNTDNEDIFVGSSGRQLTKTATKLVFTLSNGTSTMEIDYEVDTTIKLVIYRETTTGIWNMTDGTNSDTVAYITPSIDTTITLGGSNGLECILHRFLTDNTVLSTADAESIIVGDVDDYIVEGYIDIKEFESKDVIINHGGASGSVVSGNNVILWGSEGNVVFQVYPLTIAGGYGAENGVNYQSFSLQLEAMVSDDIMFGNNVEYYLDTIQVFPVDRNHTLGTDLGSGQKINDNYNKHIVEESSREHSMTFFYKPTKQLTSLLKHVVTGSIDQNTIYSLLVQFPFFQVTYSVVIENGGAPTNLNSLSTFSVTFKRKTDFLT